MTMTIMTNEEFEQWSKDNKPKEVISEPLPIKAIQEELKPIIKPQLRGYEPCGYDSSGSLCIFDE